MSSLWTPGGERPGRPSPTPGRLVDPLPEPHRAPAAPARPALADPGPSPATSTSSPPDSSRPCSGELATTPVEVVIANHCYGLFELAAVYLSQAPPLLPQARLAIDALACLVDGLEGRLGEAEEPLTDGLSQLRLAYVQIDGAQRAGEQMATSAGTNGASDQPASRCTGLRPTRLRPTGLRRRPRAQPNPARRPSPAGDRPPRLTGPARSGTGSTRLTASPHRRPGRTGARLPPGRLTPPGFAASSGCPSGWWAPGPTWPSPGS